MTPYRRTESEELLLAHWWTRMRDRDELTCLPPRARRLGSCLAFFEAGSTTLWYEADVGGIWCALWGATWLDGASLGLWVAPGHRHSKRTLAVIDGMVDEALTHWPVLIALTDVSSRIRLYVHYGLVRAGSLPKLDGGRSVTILAMTRELFEAGVRHHRQPGMQAMEVA